MYRLLTTPDFPPTLFIRERTVANALITNYYDPKIEELAKKMRESPPEERINLRERLQKFQTERLYYMLVQDPIKGYAEYKHLSEVANKRRWVGFSMRLLDELRVDYKGQLLNSPQKGLHKYLEDYLNTLPDNSYKE